MSESTKPASPSTADEQTGPPPVPATPPAGSPKQQAQAQKPGSEKKVDPGYNFAAYYLNRPGFADDSQRQLADLYQTARLAGKPVYMPKESVIRAKLLERNPDLKPGDIDQQLADMKRNYERYENGRFNKIRTTYAGMPDTPLNVMRGKITTKTGLDERPSDSYAKAAGLQARRVTQEFDLTPEQMVSENFGRGKGEETESAKQGGFSREQHEYQLAKDRAKTGLVILGQPDPETGQYKPMRDADNRLIFASNVVDPKNYGYTATVGDDGLPILMQVAKHDVKNFRGELLNVADVLPNHQEATVAAAIHKAPLGFVGQAVRGMGWLPSQVARYDLESTTGNSISRAAYNFGGYTQKSIAGIGGFIGGKFDDRFEQERLLSANNNIGALNADAREGAFSNMPSFLNSMSQLTSQLTVQQAFNLALPGAGLAVTALDATQNGYYEAKKNGITSEAEANSYGVVVGAMAFGLAKTLTGQAASKMGRLIFNGAGDEVNAIVRSETNGLIKLLAKQSEEKGMALTMQEIETAATQAKPWLVEKIGGRISALYDKAAGSRAGAWALGSAEEVADEFADNVFEDSTRQAVRSYLEGTEEGRPAWLKKSLEDGSNAFAYKSVGDILDGAVEAGLLGGIGGALTSGPMAGSLAAEHRNAVAERERMQSLGATEAFARYLTENDFSNDSVKRLRATLDDWKEKGMLGRRTLPNGRHTDNEAETENAVMHRSLVDKLTTLSELAKQTNLLQFARGEGKSKLAEELSRALGKDENYLRTQEGMATLLSVAEMRDTVTRRAKEASEAISRDSAPRTTAGDPGAAGINNDAPVEAPIMAAGAPDANGDGKTPSALVEGESLLESAAKAEIEKQKAAETSEKKGKDGKDGKDGKSKKSGKDKEGAEGEAQADPNQAPNALGAETPALADGKKQLELLAPKLGPAGNLVVKWSENQREQTNLQQELLNTDGEDVENRARIRQQLGKVQKQQEKLDDDITIATAQSPALGNLKQLAQAQLDLEKAAINQKQLFDGTLLSYQVQEGLLRLQDSYMSHQSNHPEATAQNRGALLRSQQALLAVATNPVTGRLDASYLRQQLVDNEEYVARRRYAPLSSEESGRVRAALAGAQAVAALEAAFQSGDNAAIDKALTDLEKAAPARQDIAVLDQAQTPEAEALLAREQQLDQRTDATEGTSTLDPAQTPLNTRAPVTPEQRDKSVEGAPKPTAPAGSTAEQQAQAQAQEADAIADETDQVTSEVQAVQGELEVPVTTENAIEPQGADRVSKALQKVVQLFLKVDGHLRRTWSPEMEAAYSSAVEALELAHAVTHNAWLEQIAFARVTRNKKKIAELKASKPAPLEITEQQDDALEEQAITQVNEQEAARIVAKINAKRRAASQALLGLLGKLRNLGNVLRSRGKDLKKLSEAKTAVVDARKRYGVRSLANVGAHLLFEQLLPRLQVVAGVGRDSLATLRGRVGKVSGKLATASDVTDISANVTANVTAPAVAPGIGGVTQAVGSDTTGQVARLRQAIATWRTTQQKAIRSADKAANRAFGEAAVQGNEPLMREYLTYFGRPAPEGVTGDELQGLVGGVLQELDEEQLDSPGLSAVQQRAAKLLSRLKDPTDLLDIRGTDPDERADLGYLTGLAGVPGQLTAAVSYYMDLAEGTLQTEDATNTPEKQQAQFAALPEAAIIKLHDAAQQNLGMALYRLRIVPLLTVKGALPGRTTKGMGLREINDAVAGEAIRINSILLRMSGELLDKHRQLGVNRYRDDDKEQSLILNNRHQSLTALLELPALASQEPEFAAAREQVRAGLNAMLDSTRDGSASLASLDAAETPLRALLKSQPTLALALLEDMVKGRMREDVSRADALADLLRTKDGQEASLALVLTELLGPSRAQLAKQRLQRLSQRGGQGAQPTPTTNPQLSLEQEYALQSVLAFLSLDESPLQQLLAKYPEDFKIRETFTGTVIPAAAHTMALSGRPGTGKTFLAQEILAGAAATLGYTESRKLSVLLTAPKPTQRTRLEEMAKGAGAAVQATSIDPNELLTQLASGKTLAGRVIVLDEGTALSIEQSNLFVKGIEGYNANRPVSEQVRLIVLGDPLQLPGISEDSKARANAGHPFISQDMGLLRTRPLRQIYRSGYVVLHNGLQEIGDRILTGIDANNKLASDLSPVAGVRYAQAGSIETIEGWTYLDETAQRDQIVQLVQQLVRSNPDNKSVRVLVAPGEEKREIMALQAAGLTENQAAGIVFVATDPREQLALSYDDAQGGEFHYAFVATQGENRPDNALRATYVGASRAKQYASVRLHDGQQPVQHRETGSLAKYAPLEGEAVRLRNQHIIDQLNAAAKSVMPVATEDRNAESNPTQDSTEDATEPSDLAVNEEGELTEAGTVVEEVGETADAEEAEALSALSDVAAPAGTVPGEEATEGEAPVLEPAQAEALRKTTESLLTRRAALQQELEPVDGDVPTAAQQARQDYLNNPLSDYYAAYMGKLLALAQDMMAHASDADLGAADGATVAADLQAIAQAYQQQALDMRRRQGQAISEALTVDAGFANGGLPVLEGLADQGQGAGIVLDVQEGADGRPVPVRAVAKVPDVDYNTGKIRGYTTFEIGPDQLVGDALATVRKMDEFIQQQKQLLSDVYYHLGREVAATAAQRGRLIVHTYAVPVEAGASGPSPIAVQAKNGWLSKLFDILSIGAREQVNPQALNRESLKGLASEQGEAFDGSGNFRLRYAPDYGHNYLGLAGEDAGKQRDASTNRFVVEYVEDGGLRSLTVGLVRYDGGTEPGRVRPASTERPDTALDNLLEFVAASHAINPNGQSLGNEITIEGWRNGRLMNPKRFQLPYSESYSVSDLRTKLAAEGKSASSAWTVTTPSTRLGVKLSATFSLHDMAGGQVMFISHGDKSPGEIDKLVERAMRELPAAIRGKSGSTLTDLNERQQSEVLQAILERYDLQMINLGHVSLGLQDYGDGLRSVVVEGQAKTLPRPTTPEGLSELLSTTASSSGEITKLYDGAQHPIFPWGPARQALMSSLFKREQALATTRNGKSKAKPSKRLDVNRPGLLNTITRAIENSGMVNLVADAQNPTFALTDAVKAVLNPAQATHLKALINHHAQFWVTNDKPTVTSSNLMDLLLYMDYLEGKGIKVAEGWQAWEKEHDHNHVQFNGYVERSRTKGGIAPLFALTTFPPGLPAERMLTARYVAAAEPSFQVNLASKAAELIGGTKASAPAINPTPKPASTPAPAATVADTSSTELPSLANVGAPQSNAGEVSATAFPTGLLEELTQNAPDTAIVSQVQRLQNAPGNADFRLYVRQALDRLRSPFEKPAEKAAYDKLEKYLLDLANENARSAPSEQVAEVFDEFAMLPGLDIDEPASDTIETPVPAASESAPAPPPTVTKPASRRGLGAAGGGQLGQANTGSYLLNELISNPEPDLPETAMRDINWILGSDFSRDVRDAITGPDGLPADYSRVLGRFFRGVIELNRLPGGLLSRVAARHEPLHAIMWLLTPTERERVYQAGRARITALRGSDAAQAMDDTQVEEYLAKEFTDNWQAWQQEGERYRNHPLVKTLSRSKIGRDLLAFYQGIRNVFNRISKRKDAVDRLFESAHRGYFVRGREFLLARQGQSLDIARFAARETSQRRAAYEALRKKLTPDVLLEAEQKIGSILYGAYLYNYVPDEAPLTGYEALDMLRGDLKEFVRLDLAGTGQDDPAQIAAARATLGTQEFLTHPKGVQLAAVVDELLEKADTSLAPGLRWLDVLLRQKYAFVDVAQSDAYAQAEADSQNMTTPGEAGEADNMNLGGEDSRVLGADVQLHQRDSHLVDKERESMESDRLLRQLETVPELRYENGRWTKTSNLRVLTNVPLIRHVLHRAYALAKANSDSAHPTRLEVATALSNMAEPAGGAFGAAAASLLYRYYNQNGLLQAHDALGNPLTEPSFHELALGPQPEWASFMGDALSELHGFFSTVEPRSMRDEDADALIDGQLTEALRNPVTSTANQRKNLIKDVLFLQSFVRQGNEYVPNAALVNDLVKSGFSLRQGADARGSFVEVLHKDMTEPLLRLTKIQQSGAVRGKFVHDGGFGLPTGNAAYWQQATAPVQRLAGIFGLGSVIDGGLLANVVAEHQSQDRRDFTDPGGARTLLGKVLAQTVGQTITAHLEHGRRSDGKASLAALDKLAGDEAARKALMPLLHTDLKDNTDTIIDRNGKLGINKEIKVLSPTKYWNTLLDLNKSLQELAPEREARAVYNDKNQKKATYRNTTAVYPRWRTLKQLAKLADKGVVPAALNHLKYLRNAVFSNLFAAGAWNLADISELNVVASKRTGKRKALVKASPQELYQHVFWGGFLNQLAGSEATATSVLNVPRSDKPTQKDFDVTTPGLPFVARVNQLADGSIRADSHTWSLVAHQQAAVRSLMTHDSFERFSTALRSLLARPSVPARNKSERRQLTSEERANIADLLQNMVNFQQAAVRAMPDQFNNGNYFGYKANDQEEVQALRNLAGAYSRVVKYLKSRDDGRGYWLTSLNLDKNADYDKGTGGYPRRVSDPAVKPRAQYVQDELDSLAAEVNDVAGAGLGFIPGKLGTAAWAAITGKDKAAAEQELASFKKSETARAFRLRRPATEAEGSGERYNPLLLSGLLTYRILTNEVEPIFNGHHLYFKSHQDAVKRAMARETPIEVQDAEAVRGLRGQLGIVGFEDTKLDSLHGAALEARYGYVRRLPDANGKPQFQTNPIGVVAQDARQQTPVLLGMMALESQGVVVNESTPLADILAAGNKALAGTDAHDGMSFMNMLQYRAEQHGMGNKYSKEQTVQKNILTGQYAGGSVLGKTATMLFTNELLELGNEYLYNKFVASMGGQNSLPMKAWLQARMALTQQSAKETDGDKWLAQQFRDHKDWELAEEYLHTKPEFSAETTKTDWRRQLSVAAMASAVKSGPVGNAAGLDMDAHHQRVVMNMAESGRVLSLHTDLNGATVARITQEEHIPAGLGENFKTTAEVYGFLQELARVGLLNLNNLLNKATDAAKAAGATDAEAGRKFFYKQLEQLMAGLDQRGTTLSAVERNLDPNLSLLQQHLQTSIAQAVNSAVSKLRLPGYRASVASMSGLVNMYEVTYNDAAGNPVATTRMTQQELLSLKTKRGQKLAGRTLQGQLVLGNFFYGREASEDGTQPAVTPRYSVKVDELRFLHVTDADGRALGPQETMALYRALRAGQPIDPGYTVHPSEILMPRAILAPFFSPKELAGLTARQVKSFDAAFFARRELKYLSYREGLSKPDQKLYDGLSTEHGTNREAFKQALRQLAAQRGLEIHENLQISLTPKGTRIPVTNLNSMQLFEVAGFFDSHSNTSIVPSELLTVSGADNDGDQLSHELFDVGQRGLSELSNGMRPTTVLDDATVQMLLTIPLKPGTTKQLDAAPAVDNDAPELDDQQVDTADDAETAVAQAEPTQPDSPETQSLAPAEQVEEPEAIAEDSEFPEPLRRTVQAIRRSLFKAKRKVLTDARNVLDLFSPIDIDEFIPYADEANRQTDVFSTQRQGTARAGQQRSGNTKGAYEMFRNIALHLANQAGKTGVGPFVKARELFDVYRLALGADGQGNVSFQMPFVFLGRTVTSLESHTRQAMQQLERMANAALDNAKYGYLGLLNVNEHTWGMYSAGILGGMTFQDLFATLNHQYLRQEVARVVAKNNVREPYPTSLEKKLQVELLGLSPANVEEDTDGLTPKQKVARGWYGEGHSMNNPERLLQAVQAQQVAQAMKLQGLLAQGVEQDAAWLLSYGFTPENLRKGEVSRFGEDGTVTSVEPVNLGATYIGTEEEAIRRYVLEQALLLVSRGNEMREQISLLTVLGGVPTNDYDAFKQGRSVAKALGLDPEANDLAAQIAKVGQGDFSGISTKQARRGLNVPTLRLLQNHPYLQTGLQGLASNMYQRQALLLRASPVVNRVLERAIKSAYGQAGLEADRYDFGRKQLERLADVAYLRERPLSVPQVLIDRNPAVATDLAIINRAASPSLGMHTRAGQEMTRRAIARILQTLKQQPDNEQALGRAGRSGVIQILQFSADGRRLQPEVRGGAELTSQQKMSLEAEASALPLLTSSDPAAGQLVQQLLLYYQLTSGGLRLGRGQLTELLPASVLQGISDHRSSLLQAWGQALHLAETREDDAHVAAIEARRAKAKLQGADIAALVEKNLAREESAGAVATIGQGKRMQSFAELLRSDSNPQVALLAGLFDQSALALVRPDWLPGGSFQKDNFEDAEEGAVELDNEYHYARTASKLPEIRDSKEIRDSLKTQSRVWSNEERNLPRYVQMRTGSVAGNHVYAAIKGKHDVLLPLWVRQYPTTSPDIVGYAEDRPGYSFLPVFDDTAFTDGLLDDPTQSAAWPAYEAKVRAHAKFLADKLAPLYKARDLEPETPLELMNRLGVFAFGGQEIPIQERVICGPNPA